MVDNVLLIGVCSSVWIQQYVNGSSHWEWQFYGMFLLPTVWTDWHEIWCAWLCHWYCLPCLIIFSNFLVTFAYVLQRTCRTDYYIYSLVPALPASVHRENGQVREPGMMVGHFASRFSSAANKKLSVERCQMTSCQLLHILEGLQGEWSWRSLEVIRNSAIQ